MSRVRSRELIFSQRLIYGVYECIWRITEHPIARDNVIDNEYRYTALDGIYLPAADSDRIGHNEYDCRCHNARIDRERGGGGGRDREGLLRRTAHRYRKTLQSVQYVGKINIEVDKRNHNTKS